MSDFDSRARKAADAVRHQIAENTPRYETGIRRAQRSPARRAIPSAVAAAVLIGAVAVALPRGGGGTALGGDEAAFAAAGALKPFRTCDTVLEYFKDQAPEYLIERAGGAVATDQTEVQSRRAAVPNSSGTAAESGGAPPGYSTTNIQEAGVDEPDIVKTDGNRIVAVARARAHLVGARRRQDDTAQDPSRHDGSQRVPFRPTSAGVQRSGGTGCRAWIALGRSAGCPDDV